MKRSEGRTHDDAQENQAWRKDSRLSYKHCLHEFVVSALVPCFLCSVICCCNVVNAVYIQRHTSLLYLSCHRAGGAPDDLAFNSRGQLIFTSASQGTISKLNADGSVTVLLHDSRAPEGIVVLSDGTMIFAEQSTNRIVSLAPGATTPKVLRVLPGTLGSGRQAGVDGLVLDSTINTLIVPDSPTGDVYRMSLAGQTLTLLASGLARPVGASVDNTGTIYVADECGGAVWTITPGGKITWIGSFGAPDDVVSSGATSLFVIDLAGSVHALIRVDLTTGMRTTIASQGFRGPQGLLVDRHGDIFVADDSANLIKEFLPE